MIFSKGGFVLWTVLIGLVGFGYSRSTIDVEYVDDLDEGFDKSGINSGCFLRDVPTDTSPSKPYIMESISDYLAEGEVAWVGEFDGDVIKTTLVNDPDRHHRFAGGSLSGSKYTLKGNSLSKDFTREFKTRDMLRYIKVYCKELIVNRTYHLSFPLQDTTPPRFLKDEYTFNITSKWNPTTPIQQNDFVIVGDNGYEIQTDPDYIQYTFSTPGILRVEPIQLWVGEYPEIFYYRLNIYLEEPFSLEPSQHIQIGLSAKDPFNSGTTKLNIYVTE